MTINHTNYNEFADSSKNFKPKRRIASLAAVGDSKQRLIDVLSSLGLLPGTDVAEPLKKLAAADRNLGEFVKITAYEIDQAMADVESSVTERINLKNAVAKAGMMSNAKA